MKIDTYEDYENFLECLCKNSRQRNFLNYFIEISDNYLQHNIGRVIILSKNITCPLRVLCHLPQDEILIDYISDALQEDVLLYKRKCNLIPVCDDIKLLFEEYYIPNSENIYICYDYTDDEYEINWGIDCIPIVYTCGNTLILSNQFKDVEIIGGLSKFNECPILFTEYKEFLEKLQFLIKKYNEI